MSLVSGNHSVASYHAHIVSFYSREIIFNKTRERVCLRSRVTLRGRNRGPGAETCLRSTSVCDYPNKLTKANQSWRNRRGWPHRPQKSGLLPRNEIRIHGNTYSRWNIYSIKISATTLLTLTSNSAPRLENLLKQYQLPALIPF